jgi:hypothetical protein
VSKNGVCWGLGRQGWDVGERAQRFSYMYWASGDLTYSMVTIANSTILYAFNLLKEQIFGVLHIHTYTHTNYVRWWYVN